MLASQSYGGSIEGAGNGSEPLQTLHFECRARKTGFPAELGCTGRLKTCGFGYGQGPVIDDDGEDAHLVLWGCGWLFGLFAV